MPYLTINIYYYLERQQREMEVYKIYLQKQKSAELFQALRNMARHQLTSGAYYPWCHDAN